MNNKTKWIITAIAIVLLIVMVGSLFVSMRKIQTVTRATVTDYKIGAINDSGMVIESHQSLYSKLFGIEEMNVTLKDDATVSVKVFLYDKDNNYITQYDAVSYFDTNNVPAKYFRVMITPALVDGEPVQLTMLNMARYTSQVEVLYQK